MKVVIEKHMCDLCKKEISTKMIQTLSSKQSSKNEEDM